MSKKTVERWEYSGQPITGPIVTLIQILMNEPVWEEKLYGDTIRFQYGEREIRELLEQDQVYAEGVKKRVYTVLMQQRRKYKYLFK